MKKCVYFWAAHSVPLVWHLLLCQNHSTLITKVAHFEIRECNTSSFGVLSQNCFGYSGSFVSLYKVWNICSSSVKYSTDILLGIVLNL